MPTDDLPRAIQASIWSSALLAGPLLLSLCFFCDGAYSWLYAGRQIGPLFLAASGLLGTLAVLVLAFAIRGRPVIINGLQTGALLFYSTIIAIAAVELGLRLQPARELPLLRTPGEAYRLAVDLHVFPGASPIARFTVNEVGLRGPAWPQDPQTYKIVTVGGSTTENAYLDDQADWSHLIMEQMPGKRPVWISNAGVAGYTTVHHLALLQMLAPLFKKIDMVIFLIGVNDLNSSLAYGGSSTRDALEEYAEDFRLDVTGRTFEHSWPLYRRLRSYQLVRQAVRRVGDLFFPGAQAWHGEDFTAARDLYASLPVVPLPNMQLALNEYQSRVEALAAQCRVLGIRCVFMTQPSLWREDLDSEARKLLCCSYVGHRIAPSGWIRGQPAKPQGRLSLKDSASIMARYNEVLMETCSSQNLDCLDLASQIPKTAEMFFDEMHFTEVGSQRVATVIAGYLSEYLQSEPATLLGPEAAARPSSD
jgi:lysophospholipase L1-like esterase